MHIHVDRQLSWYKLADDLPKRRAEDMEQLLATWKGERLGDV